MSPRKITDYLGQDMSPARFESFKRGHLDRSGTSEHAHPAESDSRLLVEAELGRVNWDGLKKIFESIAGRCGVGPKELNFVAADIGMANLKDMRITGDMKGDGQIYGAAYDVFLNKINFDASFLIKIAVRLERNLREQGQGKLVDKNFLFVFISRALMHEMVHAVSYTHLQEGAFLSEEQKRDLWMWENMLKRPAIVMFDRIRSGYQERLIKLNLKEGAGQAQAERTLEVSHMSFDEVITEELAVEILKEYLLRYHGGEFTKSHLDELMVALESTNEFYKNGTEFLDEVIVGLSEYLKMDKKVVWEALVRSKLEGVNFSDEDVKPVFDAIKRSGDVATETK